MANMPSISPMEIAVVTAAGVLLYVVPAALAWSERRRERRAALQAAARTAAEAAAVPATEPIAPEPVASNAAIAELEILHHVAADGPLGDELAIPPRTTPDTTTEAERPETAEAEPGLAPIELRPLDGPPRHRFRFDDLHETRLPDWPPAGVRTSPERSQAWHAAEALIAAQRAVLAAVTIASPYPARSTCLGAADAEGEVMRIAFLLFPGLWPTSANQAVAEAVIEIDRSSGHIHGWVDALRSSELSEENRREIQASGGQV